MASSEHPSAHHLDVERREEKGRWRYWDSRVAGCAQERESCLRKVAKGTARTPDPLSDISG